MVSKRVTWGKIGGGGNEGSEQRRRIIQKLNKQGRKKTGSKQRVKLWLARKAGGREEHMSPSSGHVPRSSTCSACIVAPWGRHDRMPRSVLELTRC